MTQDAQRITVQEAARRLGVKEDAIRKRIQRGTLRTEKDPEDGRVYVYMDAAQDTTYDGFQDATYDGSQDPSQDEPYDALVETLHDQVEYLRGVIKTRDRELEARVEELRRKDHIIAALTERIPAIEAPLEPPESPETASAGAEGVVVRSRWRRSGLPGGVGCLGKGYRFCA